ncbi:uncharacterized protein LOC130799323 [Amaranthus tricolor]|uniref:uncharacterized protein LOC130799323 n=1 Tax=Amaranthus tricolor TaxID=29722 RepID=UPI00258BE16E|nr:uncharacterized protein LOC130799323 [Amaranthus tricolor]
MPGRGNLFLRRLMEKCRVRKNDLLLVFIDLEKAIDSIPRSIVWDSLKNRGHVIQDMYDMYDGVSTNIQTLVGMTESFPIKVGLHQEISKSVWETVSWCILFANNIVLVVETREEANSKLEEWREALEGKGLRISCTKTEYLRCDFNGT